MKPNRISEGLINEAGLSILLQHSNNPFTILTAFNGVNTLKQNRELNLQLERELGSINAAGIKLVGHWLEAPDGIWFGKSLEEIPPTQPKDFVEESFYIPQPQRIEYAVFQQWIIQILKKFNQDTAIISDGSRIHLIHKSGELTPAGTEISESEIQQAYNTIRGGEFVFEGTIGPSCNAHRQLLQERNVGWVPQTRER